MQSAEDLVDRRTNSSKRRTKHALITPGAARSNGGGVRRRVTFDLSPSTLVTIDHREWRKNPLDSIHVYIHRRGYGSQSVSRQGRFTSTMHCAFTARSFFFFFDITAATVSTTVERRAIYYIAPSARQPRLRLRHLVHLVTSQRSNLYDV